MLRYAIYVATTFSVFQVSKEPTQNRYDLPYVAVAANPAFQPVDFAPASRVVATE